jgi:hypothetical protein
MKMELDVLQARSIALLAADLLYFQLHFPQLPMLEVQ